MKYSTLIPLVNQILAQYPSMRLTLRQIYYRLVAGHNYPNKRSSYNQLSSQLVKAREQGEVNERRIEDRTRGFLGGDRGWEDPETFTDSVKERFLSYWEDYQRNLWQDQDTFLMVWVEKDALSRVLASSADPYRVTTAPSRGYASYTYVRAALARLRKTKKVTVLHFSDHDSSGLDMTRDLTRRLYRYGGHSFSKGLEVERIALTYDQVQEYGLAPNPTKTTDTRARDYIAEYGMECWELDAIEPTELQRLVTESIEKHIDLDQWKESEQQQEDDKLELEETFQKWREAIEELDEE